ncbi:unnamed protein product [Haemonchus placei]|uniref:NGF domain-containing protein n=1 Tax=Haemonchus placei TaxID=6290 RepID=A0A0N4WVZ4_HAEPC|nr:unnamed protein product [Haemonchus placei]
MFIGHRYDKTDRITGGEDRENREELKGYAISTRNKGLPSKTYITHRMINESEIDWIAWQIRRRNKRTSQSRRGCVDIYHCRIHFALRINSNHNWSFIRFDYAVKRNYRFEETIAIRTISITCTITCAHKRSIIYRCKWYIAYIISLIYPYAIITEENCQQVHG